MSAQIIASPAALPHSLQLVRNRLVKSAMAERLCDAHGRVSPHLIRLYTEWGKGGYGLIVTGNIFVRPPLSDEHEGCSIIDPDSPEDCTGAFAKIAKVSRARGGLVVGQITHARREPSDTYPPGCVCVYSLSDGSHADFFSTGSRGSLMLFEGLHMLQPPYIVLVSVRTSTNLRSSTAF